MLDVGAMNLQECEAALVECERIIAEDENVFHQITAKMNRRDLLWRIYNLIPKHN